jgi:hypothetical protein
MARKKEEPTVWISAKEAAAILSRNSGREITTTYVRRLGNGGKDMPAKISTWQVDGRTRLYSKQDCEAYKVRVQGDGTARRKARPNEYKKAEASS